MNSRLMDFSGPIHHDPLYEAIFHYWGSLKIAFLPSAVYAKGNLSSVREGAEKCLFKPLFSAIAGISVAKIGVNYGPRRPPARTFRATVTGT
jgi:hypothetical protein